MLPSRLLTFVLAMLIMAAANATLAIAQHDSHAIDRIFGQQHLHDCGVSVVQRFSDEDGKDRFGLLTRWIFPNETHTDLRVSIGFDTPGGSEHGIIVSPVLEWIAAAREVGRDGELEGILENATTASQRDEIHQQALRLIVAMHRDDNERSAELAKAFFADVLNNDATIEPHRDSILLVLHVAEGAPETARLVVEPGQRLVKHYEETYYREPWHQHLKSVVARLVEQVHAVDYDMDVRPNDHPQWDLVSRSNSLHRGLSFPASQWRFHSEGFRNLSSHAEDFALFTVPLQGNYDIEADVTGFGWRDSQILSAGSWIGLIYDHKRFAFGDVRGERGRGPVDPPLSSTSSESTIHHRTSVRQTPEGVIVTTYLNGRKVQTENRGATISPWLGVRSSPNCDGGADDLRVTGGDVPDEISLSDVHKLPGWFEQFGNAFSNDLFAWKQTAGMEILGLHDEGLPRGSCRENALVYFRPMLEDGVIRYEFYYSPGKTMVHPALGRHSFLVDDSGVRIHAMTNGVYDRSSARPDASLRCENASKPVLKANQWNSAELCLDGDKLTIAINGSIALTHEIQDKMARHFGFFHFSDQTNARIRNVRWEGDWPKSLPSLEEQLLAVKTPELDSLKLADSVEVSRRLSDDSFTQRQFAKCSGDPAEHFKSLDDGVAITRRADGGYREARLSPNLELEGDFDITAEFNSLSIEAVDGPLVGVTLEVIVGGKFESQASVRIRSETQGTRGGQCTLARVIDGERQTDYFGGKVIDADAGRMRLSRRDDQIFYQFAENDSKHFRILGVRKFPTGKVSQGDIRFGVQVMGKTSAVKSNWTAFHARAEKISGLATESLAEKIAELNDKRDKMPNALNVDLTTRAPSATNFYRWGDQRRWSSRFGGLGIRHEGTDEWNSSGMAFLRQIDGDFDFAIEFDSVELAKPKQGQDTQIYLQIELMDPGRTQISTILQKEVSGSLITRTQTRIASADGKPVYKDLSVGDGRETGRLRIIREGDAIFSVVGTAGGDEDQILNRVHASDATLRPSSIRVMVHTGGSDRLSQIRLKSIDIHARSIPSLAGRNGMNAIPLENNQPKSILKSIFDLF